MDEKVLEYDIVIIGSGAGGGTVAKELAPLCEKGYRIVLLEWGGFFKKSDNTRRECEMARKYYFDYGGFQTEERDMTLAFARAVGGGTMVYTGTSMVAPKEVFERWHVPGITFEDLSPRYEKYIRENNVHFYSPDEINDNNKLFYEGCQKLGWKVNQFPINTRDCVGLATCNLGCAVHAKQGTAMVQIPMATAKGVEVITFCRADRITDHEVLAEVVPPEHGLDPSPLKTGRYRFRAKKIVVCGSAINSPAILMRSFGKHSLPALGRYFTCHPALILVGEHPHPIQVTTGHPKSYFCDEFFDSKRFLLETCFYYPFTLSKNLIGFGDEMDDLISHYDRLQMILVLAIDEPQAHNRITIDRHGRPKVSYRFSDKTIDAFVEAIRASTRIFFAAGTYRVHAPAMDHFFIYENEKDKIDQLIQKRHFKLGKMSISAAHLMGGCRMGDDPKTSVTNEWGKVHGFEDLYVADASLFPGPSEVNPYLTIMVLADRVAEGIRRELGES